MQINRLFASCPISMFNFLTNPTALSQRHEITIILLHWLQRSVKGLAVC